jgi:hypothetical protein
MILNRNYQASLIKGAHNIYLLDEKIGAGDLGAVYLSRDKN